MGILPLLKFSGESEVSVQFIEQFELVASAYHWYDHTKLGNLTTRFKGQAFAFYQPCSTQQRNNYGTRT